MKKVLIIGANGMAGHVISQLLKEDPVNFEVFSLARKEGKIKLNYLLDLFDSTQLAEIVSTVNFDIIINCVGVLNKYADDNPDIAKYINAEFPHILSSLTRDLKTKVIHLSTDCVFSGKEGNYIEKDKKNGLGNYADSKSNGELINNKDLTIRMSIIGPDLNINGIGLFNWLMKQSGTIYGYKKAYWSGITTIELARIISIIILEKPLLTGVIHLTNNTKINKYQLLNFIKEELKLNYLKIIETSDYQVDKSLLSTREDFKDINIKTYKEMIQEMSSWILLHKNFYPHYKEKLF